MTGMVGNRLETIVRPDAEMIPQLAQFDAQLLNDMNVVSKVFPFRANRYVLNELVDWSKGPDDPIFRLIFPSREMLPEEDFSALDRAIQDENKPKANELIYKIRHSHNPHPAGQLEHNRPRLANGEIADGLQHKYRDTLLFFPSDGQTCHSYCSFCFRWPQFVRDDALRIAMSDRTLFLSYVAEHPEISDILVTGGDAFTIKSSRLRFYLSELLTPKFDHVRNIRFGTKALSYWPYRFTIDSDASDLLRFLTELSEAGKHVAVMAHYNHPRELQSDIAQSAIRAIRSTGAVIRSQSPVMRGINDSADIWSDLWQKQIGLGIIPYYMFIARDTGPKQYFEVPIARIWNIYSTALRGTSGLNRTASGPTMSSFYGKIELLGVQVDATGEKSFVLRALRTRHELNDYELFTAKYDETASWIDDLAPAANAVWPAGIQRQF